MPTKYWVEPSRRGAYEAGIYDEKGFAVGLPADHPVYRFPPPGIDENWYIQKDYTVEFTAVLTAVLEEFLLLPSNVCSNLEVTASDPYSAATPEVMLSLYCTFKNQPDKEYAVFEQINSLRSEKEFLENLEYAFRRFAYMMVRQFQNMCTHQWQPVMIELYPGMKIASPHVKRCKLCGEKDYV